MFWIGLLQNRLNKITQIKIRDLIIVILTLFASYNLYLVRSLRKEILPQSDAQADTLTLDSSSVEIQSDFSDNVGFAFYPLPEKLILFEKEIPLDTPFVMIRAQRIWRNNYLSPTARAQLQLNLLKFSEPIYQYKIGFIDSVIKAESLPPDLKYLWIHEGGLEDNALSRAGATGVAQFMKATAKDYKLEVRDDSLVDERKSFELAIKASVEYHKKTFAKYQDWFLASAAYNYSKVDSAIQNQDGEKDYFHLLMPEETRNYILKIAFEKEIYENPEKYGIKSYTSKQSFQITYREDTLFLKHSATALEVANKLGLSLVDFSDNNPQFRIRNGRSLIPTNPPGKPWIVRIPTILPIPNLPRLDSLNLDSIPKIDSVELMSATTPMPLK